MVSEESKTTSVKNLKDIINDRSSGSYPKEAMPLGTYIRSTRFDRLGVITDAFYGDKDEDNKNIVVYTVLLFPDERSFTNLSQKEDNFYLSNEYEYEVIGYLMISPVNLLKLSKDFGGNLFL
jgi:hypothetical protein|tara:strand:- start:43 stop:408 length:366 start_codon:yes stop_codon:yes gene_type:complete